MCCVDTGVTWLVSLADTGDTGDTVEHGCTSAAFELGDLCDLGDLAAAL